MQEIETEGSTILLAGQGWQPQSATHGRFGTCFFPPLGNSERVVKECWAKTTVKEERRISCLLYRCS